MFLQNMALLRYLYLFVYLQHVLLNATCFIKGIFVLTVTFLSMILNLFVIPVIKKN